MALLIERICITCKQSRPHFDGEFECNSCSTERINKKKQDELYALKQLPVEKRLERMEEILYNMFNNKTYKRF